MIIIQNSCIICLNLKIYETTSHSLEDPKVANKQPSLIDWCVCLQKCISKFNDAFFKAKLFLWWAKGCNMCEASWDHNIIAQQTSNNEMWVGRRLDIGPLGNLQWYLKLFEWGPSLSIFNLRNVQFRLKDPIQYWEEVYISLLQVSKWTINTQWLSIRYIPTYWFTIFFK
jgi:hypothetical protein